MPQSERASTGTAAAELREWRRRERLTQREAAELIGTTDQAISNYEVGRQLPTLELAVRIEAATDIPPRAWFRKVA